MTNNKCLIYGLIDPRDNHLRYVGKSCRGQKRSEASKQKMSEAKRGKPGLAVHPICDKDGNLYNSIKQAASCIGVKPAVIGKALHGYRSNPWGFKRI